MVDRPDLDEFLNALNGFIEQKPNLPHQDPSYLRFLEIFCRSVGSAEGHLLHYADSKGLKSIVSSGLTPEFEQAFNQNSTAPGHELSPVDAAYRDRQVIAVVELKRGSGVPMWFMDVMAMQNFKALVAVPLLGQSQAVGVLCAYYRDVCLFDQGTLDRLMTIGRMVGAAMEKSMGPGISSDAEDLSTPIIDTYLELLTRQPLTRPLIYQALIRVLTKTLAPSGVIAGPLRITPTGLSMTVSEGTGIPPNMVGHTYMVPAFLAQRLLIGQSNKMSGAIPPDEWGDLKPMISSKNMSAVCQPIVWQKQPQAAVIAWRSDKKPFGEADDILLSRLAAITTLALRAV